eukprot:Em0006g1014a
MEILSVANMVNYFGKPASIDSIEVTPLLMQKGSTKLALYGLGSCRDERLHRLFRDGKVKFLKPSEDEGSWFSVLVLHQNRAKHGTTNYIPTQFIPTFFDLVIWGHEHECRIVPEYVPVKEGDDGEEKGFFISQPGSSIATSLCDGEIGKKSVGVLYIRNDCTFKMDPVVLKTVRPFEIDNVSLAKTGIHIQDEAAVADYLSEKVKQLIDKAARENEGSDKKPIVRLKVDYTGGYSTFSLARFGQRFVDQVANPKNLLLWYRKKAGTGLGREVEDDVEDYISNAPLKSLDSKSVSELLVEQLKSEKLALLSEKNLAETLTEFVDKQEKEALEVSLNCSLKKTQNFLQHQSAVANESDLEERILRQHNDLCSLQEETSEEVRASLAKIRQSRDDHPEPGEESASSNSEEEAEKTSGRGRGKRGRGRGSTATTSSRGTRGRGRGRGRGAKGGKDDVSAVVGPPPTSPLEFTSSGAAATIKSSSRNPPSKKSIVYDEVDDSVDMEVDFGGTSSHKKASSKSAVLFSGKKHSIDLTQSDDEDIDDNPERFAKKQGTNPFSSSRINKAKRQKL